ncbi:hypothetical protein GCM10010912_42140 [Paenibacillus albidus]|uniref:Uncharacterized protein n=1 Tax=Paenibacillus albidus TaxID=2041023 RepID=A0A917CNQ1_9BACL|nr:hypothetical protein [Paenibacillus albidus]GGF92692.1 hypothetical protein GCM10010912_42140 [Paenibacillus albidus]
MTTPKESSDDLNVKYELLAAAKRQGLHLNPERVEMNESGMDECWRVGKWIKAL